jgi:paraquat-inducible protein A
MLANGQEEVSRRRVRARRALTMNPSPSSAGPERVACPDCGLMQIMPPARRLCVTACSRCGRVLAGPATGRVDAPLALSIAALLLLLPALAAPLMTVSTFGAMRTSWVPAAAAGIWSDGFESLGVLVAAFAIALPAAYLGLLVWVLGNLHGGRPAGLGPAFRWVKRLRPWVMIEVFLVGCFVAYSRLKVVAEVDVGLGGWLLIAATLALLLALTQLDERTVWQALEPHDSGSVPAASGIACTVCDLISEGPQHCRRCGSRLHRRKPDSIRRTTALVAAGFILYVPANVLPVLSIVRFGREDENTILSGVVELIHNDLWPLAVIVFAASIVLPLLKLFGLSWMLLATHRGASAGLLGRTRFYRMIDLVGRWSNIDVFMVAVLVAILQFGTLTSVHAGDGLIAFAAVVLITMIATEAFDCRLMWDASERRAHG